MKKWLALTVLSALLLAGPASPQNREPIQSQSTVEVPFWGQEITTQADMVPIVAIRYDDFRDTPGIWEEMTYPLTQGVPITLFPNVGTWDEADSNRAQALINFADSVGTRIAWGQHLNNNGQPTYFGAPNNNGWLQYTASTYDEWRDELDPTALENLTGYDVKGVVWPGDNNSVVTQFVLRNQSMFERLFDELGLEYGVAPAGVADSTQIHAFSNNSLNTGTYGARSGAPAYPFMYYNSPQPRILISDYGPSDVGGGLWTERGVAGAGQPSWVTETVGFNLREALACAYVPDTESTVGWAHHNRVKTFRRAYSLFEATQGGGLIVWHSGQDTEDGTFTFAYPVGTPTGCSTSNQVGASFPNGMSMRHIVDVLVQLRDLGRIRLGTVDERVQWLASRPAKVGLKIAGFEGGYPLPGYAAINDTTGFHTPLTYGTGEMGFQGQAMAFVSPGWLRDADDDGKVDGMQADPKQESGRWEWQEDTARWGAGDTYELEDGFQFKSEFNYSNLLPGRYAVEFVFQGASGLEFDFQMQAQAATYITFPRKWGGGGAGGLTTAVRDTAFVEELFIDDESVVDIEPYLGEVPQGPNEQWSRVRIEFSLPEMPTGWDPDAATANYTDFFNYGSFRYSVGSRISLLAGSGLHHYIDTMALYWMGDN